MQDTRFMQLSDSVTRTQPRLVVAAQAQPMAAPASTVAVSEVGVASTLATQPAVTMQAAFLTQPLIADAGGFRIAVPQTYSRAEAPHPIGPTTEPNDTQLFVDGKDPSRTFYLPRYRLRESAGRYEIALDLRTDGQWSVRFGVQTYPAPEITDPTVQALPHTLSVEVRYIAAGAGIRKQLPVVAITPDAKGFDIGLHLTLEERDGLLRAFRSDEAQAQLVITRTFEVMVPVTSPAPSAAPEPTFRISKLSARRMEPVALSVSRSSMTRAARLNESTFFDEQMAERQAEMRLQRIRRPIEPIEPRIPDVPVEPRPHPRPDPPVPQPAPPAPQPLPEPPPPVPPPSRDSWPRRARRSGPSRCASTRRSIRIFSRPARIATAGWKSSASPWLTRRGRPTRASIRTSAM